MERERVDSASRFEDEYGFCRAIRVGDHIAVAGTAPIPQDGLPTPPGAYEQMRLCASIAIAAVERLGGSVGDVVRTRMFITDVDDADEVGRAHGEMFGAARPVATMVVVAALLHPSWKVEIEVEATCSSTQG